ncbi:MAG: signal peptidase I [Lachnospiraceae bacterium]|nr:signal peptidase I [Lachnospiraceae bacterium]
MDKEKQKEELKIPPIELLREELAREEAKHGFRKTLWNIAVVLIVAAALTALAATRLFVLIRINGNSMEPTLADGEVIFLRQTKEIEKGDIIGFYYGGRVLLKRVIGSAGDEINIDKNGNVYVNGEALEEPYLAEKSLGKCELEFPYVVPEGMSFVLGDNRAISIDSRIKSIGSVETEQIVGKVVFRAWPLSRMGMMR